MSVEQAAYTFAAFALTAFVAVLAWLAWDTNRHHREGDE